MKPWKPNELVVAEIEIADIILALRIKSEIMPHASSVFDVQEMKDISVYLIDRVIWKCISATP